MLTDKQKKRKLETHRIWYAKNRDEQNAKRREYRKNNYEKVRASEDAWRQKNPESVSIGKIKERKKYADRYKENARKWYSDNKDHAKERIAAWKRDNPDCVAQINAKRRASKTTATPSWANHGYMKLFYKLAKIEEDRTGRKVQVDHMVPIKSKYVCGLHCEANMQLLFAEDNASKANRHWPDM